MIMSEKCRNKNNNNINNSDDPLTFGNTDGGKKKWMAEKGWYKNETRIQGIIHVHILSLTIFMRGKRSE